MLVGVWRSGTTLLRTVFDSHPDIAVPDESNFITKMIDHFADRPFDVGDYVARVGAIDRFRAWGLPDGLFARAIELDPPADLADAVRLTFRAYAWHEGTVGYGDKTPAHLDRLDALAALLPEARFVHLIRDGRDVASAIRDAPFGPRTLEGAALHWHRRVCTGRALGAALGPARYLEVKYEDLVVDPEPVLRGVCEFLDLRFSEDMLHHERRAASFVDGSPTPDVHKTLTTPIRAGVRDWRRDLTPKQAARLQLIAGSLLDDLGYDRPAAPPTTLDRLDLAMRRAALEVQRAPRRWRGLNSGTWW
jgi:hypothetical protein